MVKELELTLKQVTNSRISDVDFNNIPFGKIFSDHMFECDFVDGKWQNPQIKPYGPLSLHPACSGLHYGQLIFEGMKANRDEITGDILLFRPEENAKRLYKSAVRMGMPPFDPELFVEYLAELLRLDSQWVPNVKDAALYIRPFMIANDNYIGVKTAQNYKLLIITCPVGPYYSRPVKVWIEDEFVRAFPGGTGDAKAAGNYGATLYPANLAKKRGYDQIVWTDGIEHKYIEEIGTMNVFFQIDNVVITPELDGTILEGITRASVIQLMKDEGFSVEERKVSVQEVLEACKNGTIQDVFGTGTAATISHISDIGYHGVNYTLPPIESRSLSNLVKDTMEGIKRGRYEDKYNWTYRV